MAILDKLQAAQDAALQKRTNIEIAVGHRRIATLALEARTRGKLTTAQVVTRYEEVTRLDPGVPWDWIELGRVYTASGNLPEALRAAQMAAKTAANERDQSVANNALGDVSRAQGDLPAALTAYRASLGIAETLAKRDPGNSEWQRDLIVSHVKLSEVTSDKVHVRNALDIAQAMQKKGRLAPSDAWMVDELKRRLGP